MQARHGFDNELFLGAAISLRLLVLRAQERQNWARFAGSVMGRFCPAHVI